MKIDPLKLPTEDDGKRNRKSRDEAPKEAPKKNWKEPDGFFQGARVKRK